MALFPCEKCGGLSRQCPCAIARAPCSVCGEPHGETVLCGGSRSYDAVVDGGGEGTHLTLGAALSDLGAQCGDCEQAEKPCNHRIPPIRVKLETTPIPGPDTVTTHCVDDACPGGHREEAKRGPEEASEGLRYDDGKLNSGAAVPTSAVNSSTGTPS